MPCAQVVQRSKILPSLVQLLVQGQEALTACGEVLTPKWLAPLLLLIDLLEKVAMCTQRRDKMYKVSGLEICYTGIVCFVCVCGGGTLSFCVENIFMAFTMWLGGALLSCGGGL